MMKKIFIFTLLVGIFFIVYSGISYIKPISQSKTPISQSNIAYAKELIGFWKTIDVENWDAKNEAWTPVDKSDYQNVYLEFRPEGELCPAQNMDQYLSSYGGYIAAFGYNCFAVPQRGQLIYIDQGTGNVTSESWNINADELELVTTVKSSSGRFGGKFRSKYIRATREDAIKNSPRGYSWSQEAEADRADMIRLIKSGISNDEAMSQVYGKH